MDEPNRLQGFPPVAGRICRHLFADFSDMQQFFLALWFGFFGGHCPCRVGITFGVSNGGVDRNQDGLVEVFLLLHAIVVVRLVDLGEIILDLGFDAF